MTGQEWRHKVLPECRGKAQEAVAQLRALGIRVELRRGDWLVFDLEETEIDQRAVEMLDRVWPPLGAVHQRIDRWSRRQRE